MAVHGEHMVTDIETSEVVEAAVARVAAFIAERKSKWAYTLLTMTDSGQASFEPETFADWFENDETLTEQAIGTVAFGDEEA